MKKKIFMLTTLVVSAGLMACGGGGKSSSSPQEETIISIDVKGERVPIHVKILDASTRQPIQSVAQLTAADDHATFNVYEDANLGTDIQFGHTLIYLTENAAKTASEQNPVHLRLVANATDYFGSSIDIIYTGKPLEPQSIYLINKLNPPEGVAVSTQTNASASATGMLSTPLSLKATTTDELSKGTSGSFELPAGTQLKDADGNVLTGKLDVTVGYFSPTMPNIEEFFPGGLEQTAVLIPQGDQMTPVSGTFVTAGLLAVDIIDENGRKAHELGRTGQMTIETPFGTMNPETGEPVREGDTIPVWSHDEKTGLWQQEAIGIFEKTANGGFAVNVNVNHLSLWNNDWYLPSPTTPMACYNEKVQFKNAFNATQPLTLEVFVNGRLYQKKSFYDSNAQLALSFVWTNDEVAYRIKDTDDQIISYKQRAPATGCQNTIEMELSEAFLLANPPGIVCPSDIKININQPFYYRSIYLADQRGSYIGTTDKHDSPVLLKRTIQNRSYTIFAWDRFGQKIGEAIKPASSCADISLNLDETFIADNPPVNLCPNPLEVRPSHAIYMGSTWMKPDWYFYVSPAPNELYGDWHEFQIGQDNYIRNSTYIDMIRDRAVSIYYNGIYRATKPVNTCAPITIDTSGYASSERNVKIDISLKMNNYLSYSQMKTLVSNMGLTANAQTELLAFTHPQGESSSEFHLTDNSYDTLMNRWFSQKSSNNLLKQLRNTALRPVGAGVYINASYQIPRSSGWNEYIYGYDYQYVDRDGNVIVKLPNKPINLGLNLQGIYQDKWFSTTQYVDVNTNTNAVQVEFEDTYTLIEIIQYLDKHCKDGQPIKNGPRYCGIFL